MQKHEIPLIIGDTAHKVEQIISFLKKLCEELNVNFFEIEKTIADIKKGGEA